MASPVHPRTNPARHGPTPNGGGHAGLKLAFDPPATVFFISADAVMPTVKVMATLPAATGIPAANTAQQPAQPSISWKATLVMSPAGVPNAGGRSTKHPPMAASGGLTWKVPFVAVRGGTLTVTATITVNGKPLTGTVTAQVLGTDPTISGLRAQGTPDILIQQMAVETTTRSQFLGHGHKKGYPLFSQDGLGGVGLGQITKPPPTDDEIWNWKANVKAAIALFYEKEEEAKKALEAYRIGKRFKSLVAAYNAARAHGTTPQPPRTPNAPKLTPTEEAACKLPLNITLPAPTQEMIENETVRRYNGEPVIGEYVALQDNGLLKVTVSADNKNGTAEWHEVTADERKAAYDAYAASGKKISKFAYQGADYVGKVRAVPLQ